MTRHVGSLGWPVLLLLVLLPAGSARASCILEPPRILWSYPADGATGVPVDTDFFVIVNRYGDRPHVEFNGALEPFSVDGRRFELGDLEPNTEYVMQVSLPSEGSTVTLETRFTTGTEAAASVATPTLPSYTVQSLAQPTTPHLCIDLLYAQDCFDTGQDSVVRLMPTGEATLWFVESVGPGADGGGQPILTAWPGECGPPPIVLHRERVGVNPARVQVTAVSASGVRHTSDPLCLDAPVPPPVMPAGCAAAGRGARGSSTAGALVLAVLLGLRSRRKRAPR